jgi:hypothetical protein
VAPRQLATFRAKREYSAKLKLHRAAGGGGRRPVRPAELSGGPRRPRAPRAGAGAEAEAEEGAGGRGDGEREKGERGAARMRR